MHNRACEAEYSIAAVSKLTGIGCHALRVWERRYGFPVPRRSPSGHRRYAAEQVQQIEQIARRHREGAALGDLIAARPRPADPRGRRRRPIRPAEPAELGAPDRRA